MPGLLLAGALECVEVDDWILRPDRSTLNVRVKNTGGKAVRAPSRYELEFHKLGRKVDLVESIHLSADPTIGPGETEYLRFPVSDPRLASAVVTLRAR
jgi:hypothetical protein